MNKIACIAGLVFLAMAGQVLAQKYPDRPIRLIVPYAPGGSVDTTSRLLAPRFAEALGQPVVVENRPGGGAIIGTGSVAKAARLVMLAASTPSKILANAALWRWACATCAGNADRSVASRCAAVRVSSASYTVVMRFSKNAY